MSILDRIGVDPERFDWKQLGLCKGISMHLNDPETDDTFFDAYESNPEVAAMTDDMCLHCPVMKQCAMEGQSKKRVGVWGGIYWNGAGKPDKDRNAHKTKEVWDAIHKRLAEDER